jgi:hypothetical protein
MGFGRETPRVDVEEDVEEGRLLWRSIFHCECRRWQRMVDAMKEDGGLYPSARPQM